MPTWARDQLPMIDSQPMNRPFSGRTYRILSGRSAVWDDYFQFRLLGEEAPASVDLPIDFWDFDDEPKLGPAVLYRRRLPPDLDPLAYFERNQSDALLIDGLVTLDASAEPAMDDDEFWSTVTTSPELAWADRIDVVIRSLRVRSVSETLGFHRTLVSKLSELAHPLRSVVLGKGEVEADATAAAIAAIVLDGRGSFEYHLTHLERLDFVEGLQESDVLGITRRAIKEGHGIDARIVVDPRASAVDLSDVDPPPSAEEAEHEAAYRELLYGFRDSIWDSVATAEWLGARALIQVGENVEELVLFVARLATEQLSHTTTRVLDRVVAEGALVAGIEINRPFIARPGLRSPPFYGISTPKTTTLADYLAGTGYPLLQSASLATEEAHPRWALVAPGGLPKRS